MGDYPDPDEEYELMYADELEMMRDDADAEPNIIKKKALPAKRSLDFSSPTVKKTLSYTESNVTKPTTISTTTILPQNEPEPEISLTPHLQPLEEYSISNKRTADDLFGDIGDIDFNEIELPSKKQKTDEENDMDMIERILEGRRLKQLLLEPSSRIVGNKSSYDMKENLSINIPRWPFLPLTNADGDRIYVRLESEESWESSLDTTTESMTLHATYTNTWVEARKLLEDKQQDLQESLNPASQPLPDIDSLETKSSLLWVDKYRPSSYLDLLSEEPVNRALLHWLHLWDKIVFKKEVKTKDPQQRTNFNKRAGQFQLTNKWKGKKESEPEMDEDGRPHHKVALLCGPPGVGKTTLAHLLARIAGYRPVELNASDERSTDAFRTALQSATLMRSVLDADRRPNCLILDEIDGAPLPTVELLVRWCTATATEGKKKVKTQPLKRPVIAICNDLYATSLRPLRPVSLIVHVGGVSIPRLSARLSLVCEREGLGVSPHVLSALAARVQGDVRAAIQVLSFIKAKAKAQLNMADVENAAVGTKDCNKSMMQALQAVFNINDKDPDAVLKTIQSAGEYDRLADGIFENYLTARVDGRLLLANETLSWLLQHDVVNSWTMRNQNYSLYGMLPLCALKCHRTLASRNSFRVKFPIQASEMYRKKLELDSIVSSVCRGSSLTSSTSRCALQLDVLPLLPYLLCPALRSANIQLCSESEKKSLRTCAGAMCDYGLQYVQQRTPDGLYAFVLEPDIYRVAFIGTEEKSRPPPAIRQAIAREQQLEVIRRNEEMANRVAAKGKPTDSSKETTAKKEDPISKEKEKVASLPNHLQRLKPKEVTKSIPQVHKDFFGRIVPLTLSQRTDAVSDVISASSVFYQYREGYNNAVRRNVRVKDLL